MTDDYAVSTRGLVKRYGANTALAGIDLDVPAGTGTAVLGPNGAGKNTAVRILTTLTQADEGRARVEPALRFLARQPRRPGDLGVLRRDAPPARPGGHARGPTPRPVPRRADHRPRPPRPGRPVDGPRPPGRRRGHGRPHHAVPRGGRAAGR